MYVKLKFFSVCHLDSGHAASNWDTRAAAQAYADHYSGLPGVAPKWTETTAGTWTSPSCPKLVVVLRTLYTSNRHHRDVARKRGDRNRLRRALTDEVRYRTRLKRGA